MKKWVWFLIVLTGWILPPFAMAKEKAPEFIVDDIIVTGSRLEQKNEKIPAQITVITAQDIKASGAQSIPEALENLSGVIVTDLNGNGFNQKIDMGGFGETSDRHVAIVVNGRKVNSIDQSGISFISIPIENVEKIEVVYGGNSVLFGGDAMGGVINIITKEATNGVHVWGETGVGSHDTLKGSAGVSFVKDRFGGNAGVIHYETDGYRDRSEADRKTAYAKFSFFASDNLDLSLEANTTRGDYQMPGGLTKAQMDIDRKQALNQKDEGESRDDAYVFSLKSDWQKYGQLGIDLSCRNYDRQDTMDSWGTYFDYDYTTMGANPQYVLDRSLFGNGNRLTLGIEFYDTDYDSWTGPSVTRVKTNTYTHDQTTAGFYAQDEFDLMDNLVLNLGGRYEDFDTSLTSPSNSSIKDITENEWAWNLGLAYIFAPGSKLYTRAYQAFRFPRIDEYMVLSSGVVNQDLKHEKSKGYEIGARFLGMENKLSASARLYTFDVDDQIAWNGIWGPGGKNENLDETRHQGGELDIKFQATQLLSLFGGMGYTDAEFTAGSNDGKKLPLVPEFKGNLGFALNFDFGLTYRCQYNYLGSRYAGGDNANIQDKLSEANTIDMYLTYTFKRLEFFLNATNIFNEEYYNGYNYGYGGSFYSMPEAVYYGGIRLNF